ncbi:MAG: hypothetical protein WEC33_06060, partial [Dehalococcoidia bacterium]
MRQHRAGLALGLTVVAAAVMAGCGQEDAGTGWERVAIAVPPGPKVAITDSSATGLWILTWDDTGSTEPPKLAHFVVGDGIVAEHRLPGPGSGMAVGAGLGLSPDGRIWAAWSDRLVVVDPGTGSVTEHRIPAAVTDRTDPT